MGRYGVMFVFLCSVNHSFRIIDDMAFLYSGFASKKLSSGIF